MEIKIYQEDKPSKYNEIKNLPFDSFYILWEGGELLRAATTNVRVFPLRIVATEEERTIGIAQFIVKEVKINKIHFITIECGGSLGEGIFSIIVNENIFKKIVDYIENFAKKENPDFVSIRFYISNSLYFKDLYKILNHKKYKKEMRYNPILNLNKDISQIWRHLKSENRTAIRKAHKNGVKVIENSTAEGISWFQNLMKEYDMGLFSLPDILENSYQKGLSCELLHLFFSLVEDKIAAGAAVLSFGDTLAYSAGGMNRKLSYYRPSNILHWNIIEWGNKKGYKWYNMVGASPPPFDSITRFKMSFGCTLVPMFVLTKIEYAQ